MREKHFADWCRLFTCRAGRSRVSESDELLSSLLRQLAPGALPVPAPCGFRRSILVGQRVWLDARIQSQRSGLCLDLIG